ncbi:MAG: hypothetical protein ACRDRZ_12220, partial [Pseudonocardiaceae bacterium]
DRARAERTKADTEYLARELAALRLAVGEVVTRDFLRSELTRLAEQLDGSADRPGPDRAVPERQAPARQAPARQAPARQAPARQAPARRAARG